MCFTHNWEGFEEHLDFATYNDYLIYGKYKTITMSDLYDFLEANDKIHFIIHFKFNPDEYNEMMTSLLKQIDEKGYSDRIAFLCMNSREVDWLFQNNYPNIHYFFKQDSDFAKLMTYLKSRSVNDLVLNKYDLETVELFSKRGFRVMYYYTDAEDECYDFLKSGGFGVYTNFISPVFNNDL